MALVNKSFEISSCDDMELNIKRTSNLEYRLTYDDTKELKALVFVVAGFGANVNISFLDFDREYLATNFDIAVVHVFYHCFCHRASQDRKYAADPVFTKEDLPSIAKALYELGIACEDLDENNVSEYYTVLNERITSLKEQGRVPQNYQARFTSTFVPLNGDYQNVGIMAAIDHINALKHLVKIHPEFANLPKITGGGSYGGYLSLLIAKIAPWYIDGVIDNSGSALPLLECIIGRELNKSEYTFNDPNTLVGMFVKTHWTANATSPYFFSKEHYMIRSLLNATHLRLQARANQNTIFVSYHSAKDPFDTARDKQTLFLALKELGFDATLHLISDESQIDGKFIKDLGHGMRIGYRALFVKELPLMLEKLADKKSPMKEGFISYPCGDSIFTFKDASDKFVLELSKTRRIRARKT